MKRGILGWAAALCALAASSSWGTTAEAQFAPQARPRYGIVSLGRGFTPDPRTMNGTMGGTVDASQFGNGCRGKVYPQPSHVLRTPTGFQRIRFVVNGRGDATMMVMLPDGRVICDDDGGEGLNPMIETASPPGDIRVWVGVYSDSNQGRPYTIGISERSDITASNLNAPGPATGPVAQPRVNPSVIPNARPGFGMVNLASGFRPDPQIVSGTAGGPIDASSLNGNCRGHITPQPGHVIMSQTGFANLRLVVNSGSLDTTLVAMLPNGQFVCDDDGGSGMNPLLSFRSPPGPIRVWVGAYSSGRTGGYNLGITEIGNVATENIPAPGAVVTQRPFQPIQPVQPIQPQQPEADIVDMQVSIPVTLLGPGLGATIAVWHPNGASPVQLSMNGRTLTAGGATLTALPPNMGDPVVTVTQRRDGAMVVRAEQPPAGRRDRGATILLLVEWNGQPTIRNRWSGRFGQRGPRWAR